MSIDPDRVFLFLEGEQLGPIAIQKAESLWNQKGCPRESWFWSPGMQDWMEVEKIFVMLTPPAAPEEPANILAVDDDPVMLEMLKVTLEGSGYRFHSAPDMLPACRILENLGLDYFACIVTDFSMPGGSGLDLIRWIRQRDESLQVLLLTARDDKQLVKAGLRAGIFDFLEKPLHTPSFLEALHGALDLTHRRREEREALLNMIRMRLSGEGSLAEEVIEKMAARKSSPNSLLQKLDSIVEYSRKLEENALTSAGMKGTLGDLNLVDIIQLLSQAGKSGKLEIFPSPAEQLPDPCAVFFENGKFYHILSGNKSGLYGLRDLLQCRRGSFQFFYGERTDNRSISGDPIALMLMISAEIDESNEKLALSR